jgi:hypothetical protein
MTSLVPARPTLSPLYPLFVNSVVHPDLRPGLNVRSLRERQSASALLGPGYWACSQCMSATYVRLGGGGGGGVVCVWKRNISLKKE